ncbi:hypothetical protein ABZ800_31985, partial [Streptomyces sp. NPDC047813]
PPRSFVRQRGHSHTGPGGQRPHCRTAKNITGAARAEVEALTDAAAESPWRALGPDRTARLAALLDPLARAVGDSDLLPPGNPVGLPPRSTPVGD